MGRWGCATLLAALVSAPSLAAAEPQTEVTFTKDVAPIFYKRCAECHRPTMFAPMSLLVRIGAAVGEVDQAEDHLATDAAVGRRSGVRNVQERSPSVAG